MDQLLLYTKNSSYIKNNNNGELKPLNVPSDKKSDILYRVCHSDSNQVSTTIIGLFSNANFLQQNPKERREYITKKLQQYLNKITKESLLQYFSYFQKDFIKFFINKVKYIRHTGALDEKNETISSSQMDHLLFQTFQDMENIDTFYQNLQQRLDDLFCDNDTIIHEKSLLHTIFKEEYEDNIKLHIEAIEEKTNFKKRE